MAFKSTEWEYSNEVEKDTSRAQVEPGDRYLYVKDAYMSQDKNGYDTYEIQFEDLTNHAVFTIRNWLYTTDRDTNNVIPNQGTRNTLIGLGKALAGPGSHIGIPNPVDIKGGVVLGIVKFNKNGYPVIYEYRPVDEDIAVLADIDQYYVGQEMEPVQPEEDASEETE